MGACKCVHTTITMVKRRVAHMTVKGYRFYLETERAEQFADFLDEVNNHMLENGEPI